MGPSPAPPATPPLPPTPPEAPDPPDPLAPDPVAVELEVAPPKLPSAPPLSVLFAALPPALLPPALLPPFAVPPLLSLPKSASPPELPQACMSAKLVTRVPMTREIVVMRMRVPVATSRPPVSKSLISGMHGRSL